MKGQVKKNSTKSTGENRLSKENTERTRNIEESRYFFILVATFLKTNIMLNSSNNKNSEFTTEKPLSKKQLHDTLCNQLPLPCNQWLLRVKEKASL